MPKKKTEPLPPDPTKTLPENELAQFLKDNVLPEQKEQVRKDCIKHMCRIMFEAPETAATVNVEDGRMKGLLTCWHDDSGQELAEELLSACMYAAYTTLKKGSCQHVYVQDLAAALNRRGLLRNEQGYEEFIKEGCRYLDT